MSTTNFTMHANLAGRTDKPSPLELRDRLASVYSIQSSTTPLMKKGHSNDKRGSLLTGTPAWTYAPPQILNEDLEG